ncbi:MAG: MgtC/SapB family protein [Alphaproteobacteria bacterium]
MIALQTYTSLAYIPAEDVLIRLLAAALCGFLLGYDREVHNKDFGLRTHILLSIGTASFVLILMEMAHNYQPRQIEIDPARVIQGVIIGIGFLAAGSILHADEKIKGVTTSAGVWVIGGIGLACGLGYYVHAVIITALVLFIMVALHPLDSLIKNIHGKKNN